MKIGLIYGGKGAEELVNICAVKDIEKVLRKYEIEPVRIYLNSKDIKLEDLKKISIALAIDSNCENYEIRDKVFNYLKHHNKKCICQKESAFMIARNKYLSKMIFGRNNIDTPRAFLVNIDDISSRKIDIFLKNIQYPLIIKDNYGSSSENVYICFKIKELQYYLNQLSTKCKRILIEEYITGREVTIPFVKLFGREVILNPIELIYDDLLFNYKLKNKEFNYRSRIPPDLNKNRLKEIRKITLKANHLISARYYSRLDMRIKQNKYFVLEINGEPPIHKNSFHAKSAKSIGLSYNKFILGLLFNLPCFVEYAKSNTRLQAMYSRSLAIIENYLSSHADNKWTAN